MKYAKMRDANEPEVIRVLRAAGASVTPLNGTGVPDLLVGFEGRTILLEVKRPEADVRRGGGGGASRPNQGGDGTLTESQIEWWAEWRGDPATVVRSADEALVAIRCWIEDRRTADPLYAGAPVASEWRRQAVAADFPKPAKGKRSKR